MLPEILHDLNITVPIKWHIHYDWKPQALIAICMGECPVLQFLIFHSDLDKGILLCPVLCDVSKHYISLLFPFSCVGLSQPRQACPPGEANSNPGQQDSSACVACTGATYAAGTGNENCDVSRWHQGWGVLELRLVFRNISSIAVPP